MKQLISNKTIWYSERAFNYLQFPCLTLLLMSSAPCSIFTMKRVDQKMAFQVKTVSKKTQFFYGNCPNHVIRFLPFFPLFFSTSPISWHSFKFLNAGDSPSGLVVNASAISPGWRGFDPGSRCSLFSTACCTEDHRQGRRRPLHHPSLNSQSLSRRITADKPASQQWLLLAFYVGQ